MKPPSIAELDLRGLQCPLPVLKARKALSTAAAGSRWVILADDPMAAIDIPHMLNQDGHTLVQQSREAETGVLRFEVERGLS